jgi:betaine-homocysteine S-methyltransferase
MPQGLLERLAAGPVLGDGGYLLELERRGWVRAGTFTPEVSIVHPDALVELHREFLHAGADVLQTLTFSASEDRLAVAGMAAEVDEINREAVRIARRVAREGDALVAGTLSPTGAYRPGDRAAADHVRAAFDRQLDDMTSVGIDFVIGETFAWLGEARICAERARATGLAVVITMAFEDEPRAREGEGPADCARVLVDAGADVVGVNCLRGPVKLLPIAAEMREAVPVPIACQPVAYQTPPGRPDFTSLPEFPFSLDPLQLPRAAMAEFAVKARELGIGYVGSCCGSVAVHVRAMARALGTRPADDRAPSGRGVHGGDVRG